VRTIAVSFFLSLLLATICVAQANQVEVPFKFENGLVIVDAKIKGDTPVKLVISTG
jgi:hypothetical protein